MINQTVSRCECESPKNGKYYCYNCGGKINKTISITQKEFGEHLMKCSKCRIVFAEIMEHIK